MGKSEFLATHIETELKKFGYPDKELPEDIDVLSGIILDGLNLWEDQ